MAKFKDNLGGVNSKRTKFEYPLEHKIKITSYWLLAFLEAERSFSINNNSTK
jgi:hypothetical protein